MQKTYFLKGLDCPHCSAQIESEASKLDCVTSSAVNLVNQTLTIESEKFTDSIDKQIEKIVHKYEPDIKVRAVDKTVPKKCCADTEKEGENFKLQIIRIAVGAVFYFATIVISHFASLNEFIKIILLASAYIILGGDVVWHAVKNILKGRVFDENFLMTVSSIGAFAIKSYYEAVAVMLLYQIGELFQNMAVGKSRKSIADLMDIRPDTANVMRGDEVVTLSPDEVEIGEIIIVKPGEKIPLDGVVEEGHAMLDTTALTGESIPRSASSGDTVLSGCINKTGVIKIEVTKNFSESTVSKILRLIQNASEKKAPSENFITKFARYYTPAVVILAAVIAVLFPLFFGGGFENGYVRHLCFW